MQTRPSARPPRHYRSCHYRWRLTSHLIRADDLSPGLSVLRKEKDKKGTQGQLAFHKPRATEVTTLTRQSRVLYTRSFPVIRAPRGGGYIVFAGRIMETTN